MFFKYTLLSGDLVKNLRILSCVVILFPYVCFFQLSILDELADSITQKGLSTLRDVFNKHLMNVTLRKEVLGLADQIQNESGLVRKDIKSIRDKISGVSLDKVIQVTEDGEFYR